MELFSNHDRSTARGGSCISIVTSLHDSRLDVAIYGYKYKLPVGRRYLVKRVLVLRSEYKFTYSEFINPCSVNFGAWHLASLIVCFNFTNNYCRG